MKDFLLKTIDLIFGRASIKVKMILNIIFHRWEFIPSGLYLHSADLQCISEKDVTYIYHDIGSDSLDVLRKHLYYISFAVPQRNMGMYFFHFSCLYPPNRKLLWKETRKRLERLKKTYHLKGNCSTESLLFHHGLSDQPLSVRNYLRGKAFLDVGAYNGDSSCVLLSYEPSKIYAFEPDSQQILKYRQTMCKNGIPPRAYEIVPFFVGDEKGENTVSLDRFCDSIREPISFLKADVEGNGLKLINGAKEMICKHRPVISIAIYHNPDEFLGIYPALKALNLNYRFEVKSLGLPFILTETVLLAVPDELPDTSI